MSKATRMAVIDLAFAAEFQLNMNQGAVYNVMRFAPTYCSSRVIEGEVYFFISRNMLCEKLSLITEKPDTMYRYYKQLERAGLIKLEKIGQQDYVHIVPEHAEKWNSDDYPNLGRSSELLGRSSENTPKNSDDHPTYIRESIKEEINTIKEGESSPSNPEQQKTYSTYDATDFAVGSESCFKSIHRRLARYFADTGGGNKFAQSIFCSITADKFRSELDQWIRYNMHREEFYTDPSKFIRGGKGNLVSWLQQPFKPYYKNSPARAKQDSEAGKALTATAAGISLLSNLTTQIAC